MGKYSRTFNLPVGTAAVQLCSADENRKSLLVYNAGSVTVYLISAQNMAITDGIPIAAGTSYSDDTSTCELFIVAASGTQDVRVMITGD